MQDCIFCRVAKGEIPHNRVYEDNNFVAFLDINPIKKGHTLLIPKEHSVWMQDTDDKIISDIFILTKKIMLAMKKGLGCEYIQILIIGKDVPHFHIHLIPRDLKDNLLQSIAQKYEDGEQVEVIKKITREL